MGCWIWKFGNSDIKIREKFDFRGENNAAEGFLDRYFKIFCFKRRGLFRFFGTAHAKRLWTVDFGL